MKEDLLIKELGSFYIGGNRASLEGLPTYEAFMSANGPSRTVNPNGDFWTGQMYVQYTKLANSRSKFPLMLWHGGGLSGSCWETTPDNREGWQMYFLRKGYDVYISDSMERGRASWSKYPEIYTTDPIFRPFAHAWESFRIGKTYHSNLIEQIPYKGSQYPVAAFENFMMGSVPRWSSNDDACQAAYNQYVEKIGFCVIIAHSQGGAFAVKAALKYPNLIKAIVFLEPSGMPKCSKIEMELLSSIPQLFIWGDFLDEFPQWNKTIEGLDSYYKVVWKHYEKLRKISNQAEWIELPDIGINGNTHMMFHDKNSSEIADLIQKWLVEKNITSDV